MTPDAYWYISLAYGSIAILSGFSLIVKRTFKNPDNVNNVLHGLHIIPYCIAAYWYYDASKTNHYYSND